MHAASRRGVSPIVILALVALSLLLAQAGAADELWVPRVALSEATDRAPVIDGALDDDCWKTRSPIGNFRQMPTLKAPRQASQFKIAHDNKALYLAVRMTEPETNDLTFNAKRRDDDVWRDDCVELFFRTDSKAKPSFYHLMVNSRGVKFDSLDGDKAVDIPWAAAAKVFKDHWTIEVAIPFQGLGNYPKQGDIWRLNVCRERKSGSGPIHKKLGSKKENSCWSIRHRGFRKHDEFGYLVFGSYAKAVDDLVGATNRRLDDIHALITSLVETGREDLDRTLKKLKASLPDDPQKVTTEAEFRNVLRKLKHVKKKLLARTESLSLPEEGGKGEASLFFTSCSPYASLKKNVLAQLQYLQGVKSRQNHSAALTLQQSINEYEHAAFTISAMRYSELEISATELRGPGGAVIPQAQVACSLVRWLEPHPKYDPNPMWWGGTPLADIVERIDAPVHVASLRSRKIWVTVNSLDAKPGQYKGTVVVYDKTRDRSHQVPLQVTVWPIRLPQKAPMGLYLYTTIPWAGETGEAWARFMTQRYVTRIRMFRQAPDLLVDGKDVVKFTKFAQSKSLPNELDGRRIEILGKAYDRLERMKLLRRWGLEAAYNLNRHGLDSRLVEAWVRFFRRAGFDYDSFTFKISDEDSNPHTLDVYKRFMRIDPHLQLTFTPAGDWDISDYRPYVHWYQCSHSVNGIDKWMPLFKLEQTLGKRLSMYTNVASWAGRNPPLAARNRLRWAWNVGVDEYTVWTMSVYPPLNYSYSTGKTRPSLLDVPPERMSTAMLVYFRRQQKDGKDFFKPVSCKRLEALRDGVKDAIYLELFRNLLARAEGRLPAGRIRELQGRLSDLARPRQNNVQSFHVAKAEMARHIMELSDALDPYLGKRRREGDVWRLGSLQSPGGVHRP